MLSMNESILQAKEMVIVVFVKLAIELQLLLENRLKMPGTTDQIQNRDFHHALIEIGGPVLDNFDGNYFLGF